MPQSSASLTVNLGCLLPRRRSSSTYDKPTKQKRVHKQGIKLPLYKNRSFFFLPPSPHLKILLFMRQKAVIVSWARPFLITAGSAHKTPGNAVGRNCLFFFFFLSHKCCQEAGSFKSGASGILLVCLFFFFFSLFWHHKVTKQTNKQITKGKGWCVESVSFSVGNERGTDLSIYIYEYIHMYIWTKYSFVLWCHPCGSPPGLHGEIFFSRTSALWL